MKTQELKEKKQFEMANHVSIIGKRYMPNDNSWQLNLTDRNKSGVKSDYLAGTANTTGKIVTILSGPFTINVDWIGKRFVEQFVIVTDEDDSSHITLFSEGCVID